MPRKKSQKQYFGAREEKAVVRYLNAETEEEKNEIFNEYLKSPFKKMIESIIRRYKLHRKGIEFVENYNDTLSFLLLKADKFNPGLNKKAYSYYGTICRNYLMNTMKKDSKNMNRNVSYEDISEDYEDNIKNSYKIDEYKINFKNVILDFIKDIKKFMKNETLSPNEEKLGLALIEILKNYDNVFDLKGNKFNKNIVLYTLRELTMMNTKEIREAMKKYKSIYLELIKRFI